MTFHNDLENETFTVMLNAGHLELATAHRASYMLRHTAKNMHLHQGRPAVQGAQIENTQKCVNYLIVWGSAFIIFKLESNKYMLSTIIVL